MLARTRSVAYVGTEAKMVEVEVNVASQGLPGVSIVGLPARSVREAEQRTRAAIEASSAKWPQRRKVVSLAPGALRKEGTHFDLALALGLLAADEQMPAEGLDSYTVVGELSLTGEVRPVRGVLAAALSCRAAGCKGIVCPSHNASEAALIEGIEIVAVDNLAQCRAFFQGDWLPAPAEARTLEACSVAEDMAEIRGHAGAKRAAEIAAAGGHDLLLVGPPGSGKTMLARRLPGILPPMSMEEALEVARIHSVAGLLLDDALLTAERPFRCPHHHVSLAGLIGGGTGIARPGEVSLAHQGVLFLDELSLYARSALDSLRAPLEDGCVHIARSEGVVVFPCRFTLVGATNPCPCGFLGDSVHSCRCSEMDLGRHRAKLSGPLLDRFDLQVTMARVGKAELLGPGGGESSDEIRTRVETARLRQSDRYASTLVTNASAARAQLLPAVHLTSASRANLARAVEALVLSGRGLDRVLRVARTVADLAGCDEVGSDHVDEALWLRAGIEAERGAA